MINIVCKQFQAPLEKKDSEETNVIDLTCECEENNEKGLEDGCDFVRACLEVWILMYYAFELIYI